DWTNARYGLRAGVVEAIMILALTLLAAPLRGWLEKSFRSLFQRETALYRGVVARVSGAVGKHGSLHDLLAAIESQTASALSLGRVKIHLLTDEQTGSAHDKDDFAALMSETRKMNVVEDGQALRALGYDLAYP